ncbi:MAG: hypothetical protein AAGC74_07785 [Verrucomicrobiota bacterium]
MPNWSSSEGWTCFGLAKGPGGRDSSGVKVLLALLAGTLMASGVTKELVRVYQPLSLHETDSASELEEGEFVQAEVVARAMVLSGAFPEDLIREVARPCRLETNNPDYLVAETNLLVLCRIELDVLRSGRDLSVSFDLSHAERPEGVELSIRQVIEMSIECIRRTMGAYYRDGGQERFQVQVSILGLEEKSASLSDLATGFEVGPEEAAEEPEFGDEDLSLPIDDEDGGQ